MLANRQATPAPAPMTPETALWLNRVGLLLDLLAFFFAAPELLGGRRLNAMISVYERGLRLLPPLALASSLAALATFLAAAAGWIRGQVAQATWRASIVLLTAVLLSLLGILVVRLAGKASSALVRRVGGGEEESLGQRFLVFGAFLFVLGMALQFVATF